MQLAHDCRLHLRNDLDGADTMLDQLYGRPSSSWKRTQVFLVLLFWTSRIAKGNNGTSASFPFLQRLNRRLARFTPWQIILSTLTILYAIKNSDALLGLQAPEPLARLYERNYYRATWIVTALDAGFATAMPIKPKWLRDVFSIAFSAYYLVFANEADEKLRKYRAVCTVEMLRCTWEKTSNPYIRFVTRGNRPKIGLKRRILLPRPSGSSYSKPITAWIYFNGTEAELAQQTELIFDMPGGGFICLSPEHHEERNLRTTIRSKRPVISFDYGKAPEYPFPYAIDEAYDAYKLLHETLGTCIGMSGRSLSVVLTGDSAGANISTAMVIKILETRPRLPLPVSLVYAYAALSFHFTSWMPKEDLAVFRQESSSDVAGLLRGKDHFEHRSPLSVVEDVPRPKLKSRRTQSWSKSFVRLPSLIRGNSRISKGDGEDGDDEGGDVFDARMDREKSLAERVLFWDTNDGYGQAQLQDQADKQGRSVMESASKAPMETRLAMTSRTAFFSDRIISPPMCRAMALLYIGPRNAPDLHTEYHISPIFTPAHLLAQFPPVYLTCGERDPFVDDTVIFAGKLREAKEQRKLELLARESRHGESLRMSGSGPSIRDPMLDEDEHDWVQMKIVMGWSHAFMMMVGLLPEAEGEIERMADWVVESFEKRALKDARSRKSSNTSTTATIPSTPTSSRTIVTPPSVGAIKAASRVDMAGTTSESDREEETEILSFTPKKRSGSTSVSRSASPAAGYVLGPTSPPREFPPRRSLSSSDDTASHPRTPENRLSPPLPSHAKSPVRPVHPHAHERALREELLNNALALKARSNPRTRSDSIPPPTPFDTNSDEELLSVVVPVTKPRSGSIGSGIPEAVALVDAKDLLRRRRADAVYGISTANSSAAPSDDEM